MREKLGRGDDLAAPGADVFEGLFMVGLREVCLGVGDEEDLEAVHEGAEGGGEAADVGVYPGDPELVLVVVSHAVFEVCSVKGAVAPFGEYRIVWVWAEFVDDVCRLWVLKPWPPEVGEELAVCGRLLWGLGCVDDGDVVGLCVVFEFLDVVDGCR